MMDPEKWAVGGIGGLAFAATTYIFRDIIARGPLGPLGKKHSYELLRLVVLCTFTLGLVGVGGYIWLSWASSAHAAAKETAVERLTEALARVDGLGDYKERFVLRELKDVCGDLSSIGKWETWRADLEATWKKVQESKQAISDYNARASNPIDLQPISTLLSSKGQRIAEYLSPAKRPQDEEECRALERFHKDWNTSLKNAVVSARNQLQLR